MLTRDQELALDFVKKGCNVLIPSQGGTGKSYFIMEGVYTWAKEHDKNIGLTSSTGISALNLGNGKAKTIHSYLGIGLATKSAQELYITNCKKKPKLIKMLRLVDILVIDEISMISAELFDKCSDYLSMIRKVKKPFGGLQLIMTGDFFQNEPVNGEYCFNSEIYKSLNFKIVEFHAQIRQEGDVLFQKILTEARWGNLSDESFEVLKNLNNKFTDIEPTLLYSKNVDTDYENNKRYQQLINLGYEERVYPTTYSSYDYTEAWAKGLRIPEVANLCVGAQVMLTFNVSVEEGLANGTRAVVVDFDDEGVVIQIGNGRQFIIEYITIKDEDEYMWACYMPLKLCWAMTIHKSQSLTLDAIRTNLGPGIFGFGQAYTSLARARNLKSIQLIDILRESFKAHEDVKEYYKSLVYENA